MPEIRMSPFKRTRRIEAQIDEYLDKLSEAGMLFEQSVHHYADAGADEALEEKLVQIGQLEKRGDELRHEIESVLLTEMLIPDARGDVLSLLDELDNLLDKFKHALQAFVIEQPDFPPSLKAGLKELVTAVVRATEMTAVVSRAYFRDPEAVRDHLHKIGFHERESDAIVIRMSREIFSSDLPLERKRHLRFCLAKIDALADEAEDVGGRLGVYAVKRSL